ncbi:MAG: hypothetical protein QXQ94_10895 [Candidatus Bathyarchaeia archaeon]
MRKEIVIAGLVFLFAALTLTFVIYERRVVEVVVDAWDPVSPSLLYPYPENFTGWSFMTLSESGDFLELNISASDSVRVLIGKLTGYNETTRELFWENIVFNDTGKVFNQRVEISEKSVNFLVIINEGISPITLSGSVKKIEYKNVIFHPYSNLAIPATMLGLSLLIFGLVAKAHKRKRMR